MKTIGLTGGVASGKSTAAKFFSDLGFPVIDADEIARELRKPGGAAHAALIARFGTAESLRLREIVFSDPEARLAIEAIMHPLIQAESTKQMHAYASSPYVIYEAALLVETGRYKELSGLIVVTSKPSLQKVRLTARDRVSNELADKIISSQTRDEDRAKVATYVIENNGTLDDLREKVKDLTQKLGKLKISG